MKLLPLLESWPSKMSGVQLAKYALKIHWDGTVDLDELKALFKGRTGVLKTVEISTVSPNEDFNDTIDQSLIDHYATQPTSTAPPIIIDDTGLVIDGHHRLAAAVERGDKTIKAYVINDMVTESLDTPYSYTISKNKSDSFAASFKSTNGKVVVDSVLGADGLTWELMFQREFKKPDGKVTMTTAKTDQGDEFKIFATVIAICIEFIALYHPTSIEFTSEKTDGNRSKLYTRLIKRHLPKTYELAVDKTSDYRERFIINQKK